MNDSPTYYLNLSSEERHDLLKLTANESGLFKKVYEAIPIRPSYSPHNSNDFTGFFTLIGTGVNGVRGHVWLPTLVDGYSLNPVHPNPEKLPEILDVGKRATFTWGSERYTGTITQHLIDGDDCSGTFGEAKYCIERDNAPKGHSTYWVAVKYCELIGHPTPVRFPYRWTMEATNPRPDWISKKIRVVGKYVRAGPSGNPLVEGQTGTISRISPVTCAWAFWCTPTGGGQDFSVNPSDCEFIDFL